MTDAPWDGRPENPEQYGWHWLARADYEMPAMWSAAKQEWTQGGLCFGCSFSPEYVASETFVPRVRYLGPCLTPDDVEARVAEARRAALKEALQHARSYEAIAYQHGNLPWMDPHECAAQAAREIAAGIEALMEKKDG